MLGVNPWRFPIVFLSTITGESNRTVWVLYFLGDEANPSIVVKLSAIWVKKSWNSTVFHREKGSDVWHELMWLHRRQRLLQLVWWTNIRGDCTTRGSLANLRISLGSRCIMNTDKVKSNFGKKQSWNKKLQYCFFSGAWFRFGVSLF